MPRAIVAVAVVVILACSEAEAPSHPITGPFVQLSQRGPRTVADEYRDLVGRAPGFASVFIDSAGSLVINVASDNFGTTARQTVLDWVGSHTGVTHPSSTVRLRRIQWDYAALDAWYQPFIMALGSLPSVTSTRIDDFRAKMVITVAAVADAPAVRRLAAGLGMPANALDVEELGFARPEVTLRDQVTPVHGGLKIQSTTGPCSLGFNGYENDQSGYPDPSKPVFMTARHCNTGGLGTAWGQPTASSTAIGMTIHEAPILPYGVGGCTVGACVLADVTVASYGAGVSQGYGVVKKTSLNSIVITGMELTRSRGHFTLWGRRSPDAERSPQEATGLPAGVSPAAD